MSDNTAYIHPSATIDPRSVIGPDSYIGPRSSIGRYSSIYEHSVISSGSVIGRDSVIGRSARNVSRAQSLGRDSRGYKLTVALCDGVVMFGAGCRWLTISQAREHWSETYKGDGDPHEMHAAITYAEAVAATWQ